MFCLLIVVDAKSGDICAASVLLEHFGERAFHLYFFVHCCGHGLQNRAIEPLAYPSYRDSLRLHFSVPHVHPFTTNISVFDKTTNKTIISCKVTNYKNKIGLVKIKTFSSQVGIWLYQNHEYELVLTTNNTSKINQDMMVSMFLFFYDAELEKKLQKNTAYKSSILN